MQTFADLGLNVSYWPSAEGRDFPKQDVQAAAPGKSSHSLLAGIPDPIGPLEHLEFQLFIPTELVKSRDTLKNLKPLANCY